MLLWLAACDPAPCPAGSATDAARERALVQGLQELGQPAPPGPVCWAAGQEPALVRGGALRLDPGWSLGEQLARAAHLVEHAQADPGAVPCEAGLAAAAAAEARGWCQELAVRWTLGLAPRDAEEAALRGTGLKGCPDAMTRSPRVRAALRGWRARCGPVP